MQGAASATRSTQLWTWYACLRYIYPLNPCHVLITCLVLRTVYCEGCVVDMFQEGEKIKCQECHISDPRGFPKVCLVLEQLLEENYPEEYNSRRSGIQKSIAHTSKRSKFLCSKESMNHLYTETHSFYNHFILACYEDIQSSHKEGPSLSGENNNDLPWWANPASNVHIGAGCDCCGVSSIHDSKQIVYY